MRTILNLTILVTSGFHGFAEANSFWDKASQALKRVIRPSCNKVTTPETLGSRMPEPSREITVKLKIAKFDNPSILEKGTPTFYDQSGPEAAWSHREYLTSDKQESKKVMWASTPMGRFAEVNGLEVIAAQFYEIFGIPTSQPRVVTIEGQRRVLRKVMDEWRTYDGEKIKQALFGDAILHGKNAPTSSIFKQTFFVSVLIRDLISLENSASRVGETFFFNEFKHALKFGKEPETLKELLGAMPINWLPITHPWRTGINEQDIQAFQTKLAGLTDSLIDKIVSLGELGNTNLEQKIASEIKRRRQLLLQNISVSMLPGRPSRDLVDAYRNLPQELLKFEPWDMTPEESRRRNELRNLHKETYLMILRAYVSGESINEDDAYFAFYQLQKISTDQSIVPVDLRFNLFKRRVVLLEKTQVPNRKLIADNAEFLFVSAFENNLPEQMRSELISRNGKLLIELYQDKRQKGISTVLSKIWQFPEDESKSHLQQLEPFIKEFATLGLNKTSEILLLSLISSALELADWADKQLSKGLGFHNALRVNGAVSHAAAAIESFEKLSVQRSEITAGLDLNSLKQILRGLVYNSVGRRQIGSGISATEAFGLGGAQRADTLNIYDALRLYIIKELNHLPASLPQSTSDRR